MLAQIKENYTEPRYTAIEWKTLEQRKKEYRRNKAIYYIKQKLSGLTMAAIGIITPFLLDGDATFSLIALPLGIYLMVTKSHVMDF